MNTTVGESSVYIGEAEALSSVSDGSALISDHLLRYPGYRRW